MPRYARFAQCANASSQGINGSSARWRGRDPGAGGRRPRRLPGIDGSGRARRTSPAPRARWPSPAVQGPQGAIGRDHRCRAGQSSAEVAADGPRRQLGRDRQVRDQGRRAVWTENQMADGTDVFIYTATGQCLSAGGDSATVRLTHCDLALDQRWRAVDTGMVNGQAAAEYANAKTGGCLTAPAQPGLATLAACGKPPTADSGNHVLVERLNWPLRQSALASQRWPNSAGQRASAHRAELGDRHVEQAGHLEVLTAGQCRASSRAARSRRTARRSRPRRLASAPRSPAPTTR